MKGGFLWLTGTGLAAAFLGALMGTLLMGTGTIIGGNGFELALTFGLMGLAWGRNRVAAATAGFLLGGLAGLFMGLLRIPADPVVYPMVRALRGQIYLLGSGIAGLAAFLVGYLAAERRRWAAGLCAAGGWILGRSLGIPFFATAYGQMSIAETLSDSFGVGLRGAAAGAALAACLRLSRARDLPEEI